MRNHVESTTFPKVCLNRFKQIAAVVDRVLPGAE
jgi:hypothetical protein